MVTHWGWDKMAAISQTIFLNVFSLMKMLEFRLKFHWSLILRVQLRILQHWFRWWLGADQATSHHVNQWCLDYQHIYVSLGLNELTADFSCHSPLLSVTVHHSNCHQDSLTWQEDGSWWHKWDAVRYSELQIQFATRWIFSKIFTAHPLGKVWDVFL